MNLYSQRGKVKIICINNSDMIHFSSVLFFIFLSNSTYHFSNGLHVYKNTQIIQSECLHEKMCISGFLLNSAFFICLLSVLRWISSQTLRIDSNQYHKLSPIWRSLIVSLLFLFSLSHSELSDYTWHYCGVIKFKTYGANRD